MSKHLLRRYTSKTGDCWWTISSGQIIATSHDLTPNGGLVREIPLFQGNLGWWNIIIWPEFPTFLWPKSSTKSKDLREGSTPTCTRTLVGLIGMSSRWGFKRKRVKTYVPSGKLTWQWNITIFNRKYIFKWSIFHCYVSLPECRNQGHTFLVWHGRWLEKVYVQQLDTIEMWNLINGLSIFNWRPSSDRGLRVIPKCCPGPWIRQNILDPSVSENRILRKGYAAR